MTKMEPILAELRVMPGSLRKAASELQSGTTRVRPSGGGFSLLEHACHLRDLEREGFVVRFCRTLEEENPKLEDIDGQRLAIERCYQKQDLDGALESFEQERLRATRILEGASSQQLERKAQFGPGGETTLLGLALALLDHDRIHRKEIEELIAEIKSSAR